MAVREWLKCLFGGEPSSTNGDGAGGCEYCRDPERRLIDGLAADEVRSILLLECPLCGQYYRYCGVTPQYIPPLTPAEAAAYFPEAFRSGRPRPGAGGFTARCSPGNAAISGNSDDTAL